MNYFFPVPGTNKVFQEIDESSYKRHDERSDAASDDNRETDMKKYPDGDSQVYVKSV